MSLSGLSSGCKFIYEHLFLSLQILQQTQETNSLILATSAEVSWIESADRNFMESE